MAHKKATWNVKGMTVKVTSNGDGIWWADDPVGTGLWAGMRDEAQANRVCPK